MSVIDPSSGLKEIVIAVIALILMALIFIITEFCILPAVQSKKENNSSSYSVSEQRII